MITVLIPGVLRRYTQNQALMHLNVQSLAEVFQQLGCVCPNLQPYLLTEDGQLQHYMNAYLEGEDVRYIADWHCPLAENATLEIIPALAGG